MQNYLNGFKLNQVGVSEVPLRALFVVGPNYTGR